MIEAITFWLAKFVADVLILIGIVLIFLLLCGIVYLLEKP